MMPDIAKSNKMNMDILGGVDEISKCLADYRNDGNCNCKLIFEIKNISIKEF
jgi:hypothetical protein